MTGIKPITVAPSSSTPFSNQSQGQLADDLLAGAIAGAIARLISAPFDVLKIRFQLQFADKVKYTSMLQALATVTREEGFFSLWKGNLSATYLWITYAMVQFSAYGWLKKIGMLTRDPFTGFLASDAQQPREGTGMGKSKDMDGMQPRSKGVGSGSVPPSNLWKTIVLFLAGAGAGIIATSATYPFDIMRTQFAVQGNRKVFPNMQSFIRSTLQTKGVRGFYAGLSPALIGITPYMGLNFALYETMTSLASNFELHYKQIGVKNEASNAKMHPLLTMLKTGFCGGFAGGVSKFVVFPLDTVKKRMQMQVLQNTLEGASSIPRYTSIVNCVQKTFATEGIKGFYRGISPTIFKAVVSTAITFAAFEGAKDKIASIRDRKDTN